MSEKIATLIVEISGKDVGLADMLRQVKSDMKSAGDEAKRTGDSIGSLGGQASKADRDLLTLASAQARLAQASGDGAQAEKILSDAIAQVDQSSVQAIRAQTQLAQVQKQNGTEAGGLRSRLDELKGGLNAITAAAGTVGIALGVQQLISYGTELTQLGAQSLRTRQGFDQLAASAGTTGAAMLAALRKSAKGEISDLNLELAANRANLLGVAKSAQELGTLMDIARDRAHKMGTDVSSAFNDLVTGLGRGSPMILDNLGITIKLGAAHEAYAKQIGKSVAALTDEEKKQALINAVLAQGRASLQAAGDAALDQAASVDRAAASWANLKAKVGEGVLKAVAPGLNNLSDSMNAPEQRQQAGVDVLAQAKDWESYQAAVSSANAALIRTMGTYHGMKPSVDALTQAQFQYAQALMQSGVGADQALARARAIGPVLDFMAKSAQTGGAEMQRLNSTALQVASTLPGGEQAVISLAYAMQAGGLSSQQFQAALDQLIARQQAAAAAAAQEALEENQHAAATNLVRDAVQQLAQQLAAQAVESQKATAQSQQLAAVQAAIGQIAGYAANGLISDAQAASVLAANYGIATGEAYNLINAQRQLANIQAQATKAKLQALPIRANESRDEIQQMKSNQVAEDRQARAAEAARRAAVDRDLAYQRASNAEKLRMTQADLARTKAYSDEWVRLKKQEATLQESIEKGGKGGAGGRAGAVKLTDQQRLNNQLLTDQEKANDKFEDEDRKHFDRLLDIEKEYAKKSLEQQKANEIAKRRSRYDFYNSLTAADITQQDAAELSRQYEEAYAKSQELAQQGKAKQAAEYLKMRQEQIQADQEYYAALKKAQEEKDSAEVERLNRMRELRKQAEAEEAKQLAENGDQNQNDRAAQIAEENKRYEDATGKIADDADASAARRVLAAQRAGKAVDDEIVKVKRLGQAYQQVGFNPTGAPTTTPPADQAATTPADATATQPGQLVAVIDQAVVDAVNAAAASWAAKLDSLIGAIGSMQADLGGRIDKVTGAVKSIRIDSSGIR